MVACSAVIFCMKGYSLAPAYLLVDGTFFFLILCFSTDGVCCGLTRLFVTFGGSGGIMITARTELPYPCSPQAKTRDESSRRGK